MTQPSKNAYTRFFFYLLFTLASVACHFPSQAQPTSSDTVSLSIKEIEGLFFKNSLQIIAQRYNVSIAQAQVITARLFQNPQFSATTGLFNTDNRRFLDVSNATGEQSGNISQEFYSAGRRKKGTDLAQAGVQQARYQFLDVIRNLEYSLRSNFYTISYQLKSAKVYDLEISSLTKILSGYKTQYAKGNIAQKELLRVQSQLYSLQVEFANLQAGIDTTQTRLRALTRIGPNSYILPRFKYDIAGKETVSKIPYQQLLDSAFVNRYDFRYAQGATTFNKLNLELQKALAVPDITLSLSYDKFGSYIRNYNGIGIGLPIPAFNRNQGVIQQARIAVVQSDVVLSSAQQRIENDIFTNYKIAQRFENVYNTFDATFSGDYTKLIQEVSKNYAKRNISLLSFLDFYESYRINSILLNNIELNRILSLEQMNLVTGTQFFNQK